MQQQQNIDKHLFMSSSQMTRKRLSSLKALTQQLRDRTKNAPLDLTHIKVLLSNSRQLHTSQTHYPPVPDNGAHIEDLIPPDSAYKPLFPGKTAKGTDVQEEVLLLRQQNVNLEQKIAKLKEDIYKLEQDNRKFEVDSKRGPYYFPKICDPLECFIGRLQLPANNFDRIEYSPYDAQLVQDRLVLAKQKGAVQEFHLSGLRGVEYCGPTVILLRFQEFIDQPKLSLTSIFLKFVSEEHQKKWDIALYCTFHITHSLEEKHPFEKYFRSLKLDQQTQAQNQRIKAIRTSGDMDKEKEKDLLNLFVQKRKEYLDIRQLINVKLEHKIKANIALNKEEKQFIGQEKAQDAEQKIKQQTSLKPSNNLISPIGKIEELEPHQEESQKFVEPIINLPQQPIQNSNIHPFHIKHTDSNMLNFESNFNSPDPRVSKIISVPIIQNSIPQGNYPLSPPPFIAGGQSQLRESKATLVNQLNNIDGRAQSFVSSSRNNSASKFKEASQEKLNNAKIKLQNGYFATKYSKDGFSPHDKKVFLSLDSRKFCWSDRDKQSEYKSVPIAVLIGVEYGVVGEGIAKHIKNPDARYFCVIQYYTSDYKKKTIQLGSGNMQEIKDLSSELTIIIHNRQAVAPN